MTDFLPDYIRAKICQRLPPRLAFWSAALCDACRRDLKGLTDRHLALSLSRGLFMTITMQAFLRPPERLLMETQQGLTEELNAHAEAP